MAKAIAPNGLSLKNHKEFIIVKSTAITDIMTVNKPIYSHKIHEKIIFTVNVLMIINLVCTPSLAKSNPSKQTNNETAKSDKLCYELLQQAYPKKSDQLAYAASYDGTLPKSWDAYNKAQRIGCAWVNQRKPGQPCVDYWLSECRGRKPANIPIIHSPGM